MTTKSSPSACRSRATWRPTRPKPQITMVVLVVLDLPQGTALLEETAEMAGDEELRDRDQGVEERTRRRAGSAATLTIWPPMSSGSGIEPTVAIVSSDQKKPCQTETSSVTDEAEGADREQPDDQADQRRQAPQERPQLRRRGPERSAPWPTPRPRPRRWRGRRRRGRRRRRPPSRRRRGWRRPRRRCPPSRVDAAVDLDRAPRRRSRAGAATLSGEAGMNGCPPQPGLTVMQRRTSA